MMPLPVYGKSLQYLMACIMGFLTLAISSGALAQTTDRILTNFRYLDSYGKAMIPASVMVIKDGKIAAIDDDTYPCVRCETLDLGGAYIIPGLIDMHQHLDKGGFSDSNTASRVALFRKNLYWGITTAFNPSLPSEALGTLKAAIKNNPLNYPRFLTAGRTIGPKNGWGDLKTATIGGLKTAIDQQIKAGASAIKLSFDDKAWLTPNPLPMFSEAALKTAIDYAHKRERRVFVHTTTVEHAKAALRAGADGLISGLVVGAVDNEFISMMRANRTAYIATLTAFEVIADVQKAVERQHQYDGKSIHGTGLYKSLNSPIMAQNWRDWWPLSTNMSQHLKTLKNNTKKLIDAGVNVGIGTDAGTPAVIFGASLADELARHVELGLDPLDAIIMATQANARLLYLDSVAGTVEVGKTADLIFMKNDPSKSIDALKSIQFVMRGGRLYDRREFENGQ